MCIVDAGNLERNLYLVSQVLELGLPTVLALNMLDVAAARGIRIDLARFQRQLGIPDRAHSSQPAHRPAAVEGGAGGNWPVGTSDSKGAEGMRATQPIRQLSPLSSPPSLSPLPSLPRSPRRTRSFAPRSECCPPPAVQHVAQPPARRVRDGSRVAGGGVGGRRRKPAAAQSGPAVVAGHERLLAGDAAGRRRRALEGPHRGGAGPAGGRRLSGAGRRDLGPLRLGPPRARAAWPPSPAAIATTATDRIDRVLTHRLWGTLIFAVVMVLMFQSVFVWAKPAIERDRIAQGARPAIGSDCTWPKAPCEACWPTA